MLMTHARQWCICFMIFLLSCFRVHASQKPRLVIIISLDQFRSDYIPTFREHFGKSGFALLLEQGANFPAASYEHALTLTGPGHAVIGTGSYGTHNGIIAN